MKVAFTTSTGVSVDMKFRSAGSFTVWNVMPDGAYYVTTLFLDATTTSEEERITSRADALAGCDLLCTHDIGGPAKARLAGRHIRILEVPCGSSVEELITKLRQRAKENSLPWTRTTTLSTGDEK